jgi:hypothetical protein
MRTLLTATVATLPLLLSPATPGIAQATDAKPLVLTVEQAIRVANGLSQLDCYQPVDGGIQQGCKKYFDIDLATHMIMARNIQKGSDVSRSYNTERSKRVVAVYEKDGKMSDEARARLELEDNLALTTSSGVTMECIRPDHLFKEATPAASTIIAMVLSITSCPPGS